MLSSLYLGGSSLSYISDPGRETATLSKSIPLSKGTFPSPCRAWAGLRWPLDEVTGPSSLLSSSLTASPPSLPQG